MSNQPSTPPHFAPLRRLAAEPVTDPAEQAALDEQRKRQQGAGPRSLTRGGAGGPAARVLDLCRQLPAEDWLPLLSRLAAQLSPDQRLELLAHLLSHLPPDALRQVEGELQDRVGRPAT
jgi:hypothetical protein